MKKKTLLIIGLCMIALMPLVKADLSEFFFGSIINSVNVAFDYIVKFIQWVFLAALNITFLLLWVGYFAMLIGIGWLITKVEPYVKKISELTKKLKQWVEGK